MSPRLNVYSSNAKTVNVNAYLLFSLNNVVSLNSLQSKLFVTHLLCLYHNYYSAGSRIDAELLSWLGKIYTNNNKKVWCKNVKEFFMFHQPNAYTLVNQLEAVCADTHAPDFKQTTNFM